MSNIFLFYLIFSFKYLSRVNIIQSVFQQYKTNIHTQKGNYFYIFYQFNVFYFYLFQFFQIIIIYII